MRSVIIIFYMHLRKIRFEKIKHSNISVVSLCFKEHLQNTGKENYLIKNKIRTPYTIMNQRQKLKFHKIKANKF